MLARVQRLPGKALGALFGTLLLVHAGLLLAGFHQAWFRPSAWQQNALWFGASLAVVLLGRLLLAFLPPGPTGAHDLDGLAETWAASLGVGWLALAWGMLPPALLRGARTLPWLVLAAPLLALLLLAGLRWITLPGAMVPRHRARLEPFWPERAALLALLAAWSGYALFTRTFAPALTWVALAILVERGLARARRAAAGRLLLCGALALLGNPSGDPMDFLPLSELGSAAALGLGGAYLIPWLRCADRRAGVLAALSFSSLGLAGWNPLVLVALAVFVLASHPGQRRFALSVTACAVLAFAGLRALLLSTADGSSAEAWAGARGRTLLAFELLERAGERGTWGLAWPLVLLALLLGALTFRWRDVPWTPGTIEEPRREARALSALLVLSALALALPASPWFEGEVLVILFPLAALLAGLLLLPAERSAAPERAT